MTPIDPFPYAAIYVVVVFIGPWMTFAWLLWRELRFARSHGIALTAQNWRTEWPRLKRFRREDPQARRLYELVRKWLRITLLTWIIGFIVAGGTLFILERAGVLVGPYSGSHG
jgi:hypothetical protein